MKSLHATSQGQPSLPKALLLGASLLSALTGNALSFGSGAEVVSLGRPSTCRHDCA